MSNQEIARLLRNVAVSYVIQNEDKHRFQIIAYQRAADAIDRLNLEVKDLYEDNKLDQISGVGPSIQSHLEELFKTGRVKHFEAVMRQIPEAVFPLLDVPSFGPKKAYKLVRAFRIQEGNAVEQVFNLARKGKIASLEGFGEKSQTDIIRAIEEYRRGKTKSNRMVLPYAFELSRKICEYLKQYEAVKDAQPLGSLKRMVATVGDIDIAVASNDPKSVIEHFILYPSKERVIEKGEVTSSILLRGGKQVDLMVQNPDSFGSLLQHFTGSKHHNVALREYALKKGLSLSEFGVKRKLPDGGSELEKFSSEEKFYEFLGMDWIPPELRENQGEIERAVNHSLPELVELKDIKGDLHLHSNYPIEPSHDLGENSMEEMLKVAENLKYEYIGFSEHNPSITQHSEKEVLSVLSKRKEFIEQLKKSNKDIRIINLLEVDILASGKLALNENALELIDAAIVSIHSSFNMEKSRMTQRVLQGLSHPKAKILAHPTGRLLNQRAGYELNWDNLFGFMKKENKALEINAWPTRLDLPDSLVKEAKELGVKLVINTDSHASDQMENMYYGVAVAKRGWAQKNDILNTLPYNTFIEWLKS